MTTPAEHPILFQGPMVRAILAGTKTQTRRLVKPQPLISAGHTFQMPGPRSGAAMPVCWQCKKYGVNPDSPSHDVHWYKNQAVRCPYGKPGEQLWVKETLRIFLGRDPRIEYRAGGVRELSSRDMVDLDIGKLIKGSIPITPKAVERAEREIDTGRAEPPPWRPSIHCPRRLSRITLEIVSVKAERVRDITDQDAKAEGIIHRGAREFGMLTIQQWGLEGGNWVLPTPRDAFLHLFYDINGRADKEANPWVFAVTFRRIKP